MTASLSSRATPTSRPAIGTCWSNAGRAASRPVSLTVRRLTAIGHPWIHCSARRRKWPGRSASAWAPAAAKVPAAEKVVLDPEFRIGTSKLEPEGFYVAVARRGAVTAESAAGNRIMFVEDEPVTNAVMKKVLTTDGFEAHGAF